MQTFIVLGIIPGTDFQLTFNFWLDVVIVLAGSPLLLALWRRRNIAYNYFVAFLLARFIAQYRLPA
jgi:hypothetical protein